MIFTITFLYDISDMSSLRGRVITTGMRLSAKHKHKTFDPLLIITQMFFCVSVLNTKGDRDTVGNFLSHHTWLGGSQLAQCTSQICGVEKEGANRLLEINKQQHLCWIMVEGRIQ